jgi:mRNA interferase RelE/StbE
VPAGYQLLIYRRLEKDIADFPRKTQEAIRDRIRGLREEPRPPDAVKLQGARPGENYHRLRVGNYRIIYDIDDDAQVVRIMLVGHRRNIYDLLRRQ